MLRYQIIINEEEKNHVKCLVLIMNLHIQKVFCHRADIINRPGVARAVLQTQVVIHSFID